MGGRLTARGLSRAGAAEGPPARLPGLRGAARAVAAGDHGGHDERAHAGRGGGPPNS